MHASEAKTLYDDNWDRTFTTLDALHARIKALAENGAGHACVYIDSKTTYDEVKDALSAAGFAVDDYNGGNNGILEIGWGV